MVNKDRTPVLETLTSTNSTDAFLLVLLWFFFGFVFFSQLSPLPLTNPKATIFTSVINILLATINACCSVPLILKTAAYLIQQNST